MRLGREAVEGLVKGRVEAVALRDRGDEPGHALRLGRRLRLARDGAEASNCVQLDGDARARHAATGPAGRAWAVAEVRSKGVARLGEEGPALVPRRELVQGEDLRGGGSLGELTRERAERGGSKASAPAKHTM